jgi:predicted transposase/invertase (TIGR01784 family)
VDADILAIVELGDDGICWPWACRAATFPMPMRRLLDPTLDVVFKLLFTTGPESPRVLRSLLTAVLRPKSPITSVTVLNPEIPRESVLDKGIVLDLLAVLEDGTRLDVEMQSDKRPAFRNRALYYWARTFSQQLERGADYHALRPVISVLFLDYPELEAGRLHSIFQLLETHDHVRFTDALEIHLIELPELRHLRDTERDNDADLVRWSRFFAATNDAEIEDLAMSDSAIRDATNVLERLSADPAAQALARQRELALVTYKIEMTAAKEEGIAEGKAEGLRIAIEDLCESLGIELDPTRRKHVAEAEVDTLNALRQDIKASKRWPAGAGG